VFLEGFDSSKIPGGILPGHQRRGWAHAAKSIDAQTIH
jgi:hypothetical protein